MRVLVVDDEPYMAEAVSALRKRLGEPCLIATVPGVGYRMASGPDAGAAGGESG